MSEVQIRKEGSLWVTTCNLGCGFWPRDQFYDFEDCSMTFHDALEDAHWHLTSWGHIENREGGMWDERG